jgi:diaminohydroxyphosphoribosylaminopyrimidine deaminase / 5-amino-6-(5-phosphoribosylamino)uracil reductase
LASWLAIYRAKMPRWILAQPDMPLAVDCFNDLAQHQHALEPEAQLALDLAFMRAALAMGERGLGMTAPNPSVGAVVVREVDGVPVMVGRGFTQAGGRPHGEPVALERAGDMAVGATLYVTLEPCSHRTVRAAMPCAEYILRSGVRRVVTAMVDPNPMVAGLGHGILRTAGIKVTTGILAQEAARAHRGHVLRITQARPMVTLKIARTADGFAGGLSTAGNGARIQVSCPLAGRWVHLQRALHDAIMIGVSTALADNPQLNVRLPGLENRSPIRVVLDSNLRIEPTLQLVRTARDIPVWLIAAIDAPVEPERKLVAAGVEVMRVPRGPGGHVDLAEALRLLAVRGITRVFSEGGPTVGAALAVAGLADEIIISTSPHKLGAPGVLAVTASLQRLLADPVRYAATGSSWLGDDELQSYERVTAV